ncbi:glycoside hydrolase [Flavobacterium franklandianum]|uniref:Glycoside hydrolase n=1 Tax=Flavobacterium franklandianum TaxID=2594430 RepID=A0A553C6W0_9FLAO|nr:glycoside hydrolase [Flavobacterium franklandianum]TRX16259.1 glycoside hydrolase [Flavobacterium franklandianum]TRX25098.1 glycoside hydrolase [Flavobacterium franklandianum]
MKKLISITILFCLSNIALFGQNLNDKKPTSTERIIKVDYTKSVGQMNTMFKECIGAGRANEGLRADWQQQLAMVKKECDFKYIRMHGLLTDDMGVYREDSKGNPEYNYQYIDVLYDFLLSIKIKPFVELGFMPSALASGNQTIFWWKGNVTPPKDYKKWEDLISNLTQHFTERYGAEEVKTWYFEVWNEPNLTPGFWTGTQAEYFKLYDYSTRAIKSVNPDYKVGGPGTAGAAWESEMIDFCEKNKVPIDFVSTHSYGVGQGFLDEFGQSGTVLSKDNGAVSGDVLQSRKEIAASTKPNLELHYTEWSSSYTPADPIHDSYHSAAYILQKLKQVGNAANSMSYWVFTDIFEEPGPRFTPFHGGFGLLNTQGIKKPAYFSYSFLKKLGTTELQNTDTSSWATKNTKGDVQVLLWDFTYTLPDATNNQQYYIKDLPSKPKGKVRIEVGGLSKGNYKLEIYKVGYKVNDVFTDYLSMNKPNQLTKEQVKTLKEKNNGSIFKTENVVVDTNRKYSKDIDMNENDVYLFNFIKQ